MTQAPIQVGVVGAGYWGPNIVRNLMENPDCYLAMVCDKDQARLARMAQRYPSLQVTTNYQALLNDSSLDAIAIVTDIGSHFPLAEAALRQGKHVFVEKPLALTSEQCLQLGRLAAEVQRVLMVGHTFVYNPAVRKLKEIADSGALGNIYYMHAQRLNLGRVQVNTNAMWSLAVHDVSIALYLFGERPQWVRAWGHAFITPGAEDVTFLNMHFPSGRLAHVHASWLDPEKKRQVTLVGSKQMAVYDDVSLDRKIMLYDKGIDKALLETDGPEYENFSQFQLLTRTGDVHIPHLNFSEPLQLEVQHFLDCVRTGDRPMTSWEEGYEVVKVLEAAQQSLDHAGIPIELDWEERIPYAAIKS